MEHNLQQPLSISTVCMLAHGTAREKGFYDKEPSFAKQIALCHSELSEALEEHREGRSLTRTQYDSDGKPLGIPSELADTIIRVCDLAAHFDIDLEAAVREKLIYNMSRVKMHAKNY